MSEITLHVLDINSVIETFKTHQYDYLLKRYKACKKPEELLIDKFLLGIMNHFEFYEVLNNRSSVLDYEEHSWIMDNHNAIRDFYRLLKPLSQLDGMVTLDYKRIGAILFLLVYN